MSSRFLKQKYHGRSGDRKKQYSHEYHHLLEHVDESEDEGSSKTVKLPLRTKRSTLQYLEYAVQPEDTLLSISLRFNCSAAQIKQVNSILRDNEIFALRTLRIPVPPFSALRDSVAAVHSGCGGAKAADVCKVRTAESTPTAILVPIDTEPRDCSVSHEGNEGNISDEGLHNPLLVPLPTPFQSTLQIETEAPPLDLSDHQHSNKYHCSGADCGLSWLALVLCSLVLGFAGPLIYIFFLYERQQERREHTHS